MLTNQIEDVKNRLDIVEVVSGYIKLHKTGANYRANCPFHTEKTPSFFVSPTRQMWHCFGCSKGGSAFDFVMQIEGIEFGDALRILAQRAGVELKPFRPEMKELTTERARYYEICDLATSFFEKQLGSSAAGKEAKDYLLGRGITEESIKHWRLGYSPDTWQGLLDFLVGRGYKKAEIEKAGLAIKKPDGGFYDRFRGRIIFPVFDINSQVIGFGGRVFSQKDAKEIAKYINTPATILYDKSKTLYGLNLAKVAIRQQDNCILVEGYTDAILSHQAGVNNVVAASGTALTPWHLKILRRYTEKLFISFDMDFAGDTATKRGIDLALSQGFDIRVITLPEGKDPADLVVKSPEAWAKAVQTAKSILEFYFESTLKKFDQKDVRGKKEIAKILLPVIKKIPNKIEQTFWLGKLSQTIEAREQDLNEEMAKLKTEDEVLGLEPEEAVNLPVKTRQDLLEERLATLIIKNQASASQVTVEDQEYLSPWCRQMVRLFAGVSNNEEAFQKMSGEVLDRANYLALKAEALQDFSEKEQQLDFVQCLKEIRNNEIKRRLELLSQDLRTAETEQNTAKTSFLVEEFQNLTKKLTE